MYDTIIQAQSMVKRSPTLKEYGAYIFLLTLLSLLPIIVYPDFYLGRQNDLTNFFLPLITYTKNSLFMYHQLPLWNLSLFSGTPMVTDPQAGIFYLPNIIHLLFSAKTSFLLLAFLHLYVGALGVFGFLNKTLKLQFTSSMLGVFMYLFQPRLGAYFEAGHVGLIYSWAYLPWLLLFLFKLKSQKFWPFLGMSVTLAGLFYTHTPTFILASAVSTAFYLFYLISLQNKFKFTLNFFLAGLSCFGFIAVALLPQLAWQGTTTRQFLLKSPEFYPQWQSVFEFVKVGINPMLTDTQAIWELETEKYLALGVSGIFLSLVAFLSLKTKIKLAISFLILGSILISLSNASPIYFLFSKNSFFILMRVMSRVWFIPIFTIITLAPIGYQIIHRKYLKLGNFLLMALIIELSLLFWGRMAKPISISPNTPPEAVYMYLQKNSDGRVFCTTKCLRPNKAVHYGLETIEGYGTMAQTNYFHRSMVTMGTFWIDKYDLSIPPSWITYSEKLSPQALYLAEFNVDLVVSPHELTDKNLKKVQEIDGFMIYKNLINKPRAYFTDGTLPTQTFISPNKLTYEFSGSHSEDLILSEVYADGWHALLDGKALPIKETDISQRSLEIPDGNSQLSLYYLPNEFVIGSAITFLTVVAFLIYAKNYKRNQI